MSINLSSPAAQEIQRILRNERKEGWGLRVGVKGGGCSGLSYTMTFEETPAALDKQLEVEGIRIFVDPKSYLYLNGLTLDFTKELIGGGFKFVNPNAVRTCSCGTSFSA